MAEWNAIDDAVVREGLSAGRSYEQIATELGRTPTAVQVRMFSLGLAQQQQLAVGGDVANDAAPKRRGRPPKVNSVGAVAAPAHTAVAPKRRGRPPKVNSVGAVAAPVAAAPKRRGRPPKVVASAVEVSVPVAAAAPKAANGNGQHAPAPAVPAVAKLRRARADKSEAPAAGGGGFMIALGAHRLTAEGAAVELIEGGGLRLKFAGGSIELHGSPSA